MIGAAVPKPKCDCWSCQNTSPGITNASCVGMFIVPASAQTSGVTSFVASVPTGTSSWPANRKQRRTKKAQKRRYR